MSFFGKKKDGDFKARLERKLYLARADPEPIFDLSECDLKAVPSGVFSLCKVLRKEQLFLQSNHLTRLQDGGNIRDLMLLETLDIHSNKLAILPHDIRFLKNLKDLNVSNNLLKELPEELCELTSLRSLDVSCNKLADLPSSIGNLKQLQVLKIQGNKQLNRLPNSLGKLKTSLRVFEVDVDHLEYPNDVSIDGPTAAIKYLAKAYELLHGNKNGSRSSVADETDTINSEQYSSVHVDKQDDYFQARLRDLDEKKEGKMKGLIAIEKELQEQKAKEFELQKRNKEEKNKLLEDILVQESSLHNKLVEFQVQKDAEKLKLMENLLKVEDESDRLLENLLKVSQTLRNPNLLQDLDRTRQDEMLSLQTQELRRKEVLDAMEKILADELECNDKLLDYKRSRDLSFRDCLLRMEEMEQQLMKLASQQQNVKAKWLAELKQNCGEQGMVLGILLEKTDIQSQALLSEVTLVQQQLAALTSVELKRKQLNADQRLNELGSRRIALSGLLVDLMEQQDKRRKQLLQTLVDVQEKNQKQDDKDFWLKQYQRLMDQCPESLIHAQRCLDPLLVHFLVQANAAHCLPYLATCSIQDISYKKLEEMGVSKQDIYSVMDAIEMYKEEKSQHFTPSAPELQSDLDEAGPSAPSEYLLNEDKYAEEKLIPEYKCCVICMDEQYQVVFIPCGHLCVCMNCSSAVTVCPLCRATIGQKIHVIVP